MNVTDTIKTSRRVVPMIYAYTTPEIARHNGWTKIGYTEQDVVKRLDQQTHTADVKFKEEWRGTAIFEDGSGDSFKDKEFHAYLKKSGVENIPKTEWFKITGPKSRVMFYDFKSNRGILEDLHEVISYQLRDEQEDAVQKTKAYIEKHPLNGEFLWNAKPRFGKTLSVYDFVKRMNANNVLIVTNRPAIANSWYSDYEQFLGTESGYRFVSNTSSLAEKALCITRQEYQRLNSQSEKPYKCIEFLSLQDLKGSIYFGGDYDKLREVRDMKWDILVIDEAHEGVDTTKTDIAFDKISRNFTLHLSGTPFKALANDKFAQDAIYNWTYADEQKAKRDWNKEGKNPYETLPRLNMFTYQMSELIKDELEQGIEINGETEEYAFDLNLFFETKNGKFIHEQSVDRFLDAMTMQTKFPFSTEELRNELKHTFWLLNRVDSAKALAKKLQEHPIFKEYKIVLAAGDGKLSEEEEATKAYDKVVEAIKSYDKTITLSVGQLATGITIPEWTAVLMLSSLKSPALYMQAAFRAQNPCLFYNNGQFYRKKNAYVFDFDPARTLTIFEEFANDLSADTAAGKGDSDTRKDNVRELLNFFPVIGEDSDGEMIELDAEKVLSIPRKIRSQEVVRRGFMSDFLFQHISNVFHAPQEVINIISSFTPTEEPKNKGKINVDENTGDELYLDENGEIHLTEDYIIGKANDIFGDKIYGDIEEELSGFIEETATSVKEEQSEEQKILDSLQQKFNTSVITPILNATKNKYEEELKPTEQKQLEKKLQSDSGKKINRLMGDYTIQKKTLEQEKKKALSNLSNPEQTEEEIHAEFEKKQQEIIDTLQASLETATKEFIETATKEVVETVETSIKEKQKDTIESSIRDHLRGFSRTIPSFLMAYGDENVTLDTFDQIIPDEVFKEVTSITLEQFRFLRDGGDYSDEETGETKHFDGHLFEPVVFDDSVKEFMRLKKQLANYFEESSKEDIFDYIPPQKTNQIYTPKKVVKKMVDLLETENPGCFDRDDKTFIDMYMKSGLYITEIVKRLYNSAAMKYKYPNDVERLRHIFEKQVYGLAPTEIIYKISTNYILGFNDTILIEKHNFKHADALPYAKEGRLEAYLKELYQI